MTRHTKQKDLVLSALAQADHPTATELYEKIEAQDSSVSRATVFRLLTNYAADGTIQKVILSDGETRYDTNTRPHAHARCLSCGAIYDVHIENLPDFSAEDLEGFEVSYSSIELYGRCEACREKEEREKEKQTARDEENKDQI